MIKTYSTGPEGIVQGISDSTVRRRGNNTNNQLPRNKPDSNGSLSERDAALNRGAIAGTTGPSGFVASRGASAFKATRRKLPWLDGKASPKPGDAKFSRIPGAFIISDSDETPSSTSPPSPPKPVTNEQKLPGQINAPSQPPIVSVTTYTPSVYSAAAPSGMSADHPVKNPRPQKSYEALVESVGKLDDTTYDLQSDAEQGTPATKAVPSAEDWRAAYMVPPPVGSPMVVSMPEATSPSPLSPTSKHPPGAFDDPIEPSPAEAGLRTAISGLESLMQEAIDIAKDAADHHRPEDVSDVLNGATRALRRRSTVKSRMEPLLISDSSSSSESSMSEVSYRPKTSYSSPTVLTGDPPADNTKFYGGRPSEGPIVTDWAYVQKKAPSPPLSSSSESESDNMSDLEKGRKESTHWRAWHNNTVRPHYRDDPYYIDRHVHPTHTPPLTWAEVHNHSSTSGTPPIYPRDSSLRHRQPYAPASHGSRRSRQSEHLDDKRKRRRERRSERRDRYAAPKPQKPRYPGDVQGTNMNPEMAGFSLKHPRRRHGKVLGPTTFDIVKRHRRQPIARNWGLTKKRVTATIACVNTALVGFLIGVYAGEVPRIQYAIADQGHFVILGNAVLYLGLALSTFFSWPLPLLHGRKPYTLGALALLLPLQFPQALVVDTQRDPETSIYRVGLLLPRAVSGLVLGFANVNGVTTLLDLFGASLQAANPHQELVFVNDVRRHGGGMGLWLGIWSWCFIGSIAVGFMVGAVIINDLNPSWGFYVVIMMIVFVLVLNIIAPETRRARYRQYAEDLVDPNSDSVFQRFVCGEIKLHISTDGPQWWGDEVFAGVRLSFRMFFQMGFGILATYLGWIYAQFVLVIVLLGALLSRDYRFHPQYVGAGVTSLAIGALLAVPLSKAGLFSRERTHGPRTDSMTFQKQITWTSHMTRRIIFTATLPFAGMAYTLSSPGISVHHMVPIAFAGLVGFLSNLALAECHGLIMEAFDTCDLQPGANTKHRLQSMAAADRRRRTPYSSFPRVSAGFFVAQTLAFTLAAAATLVGGAMTRHLGAQTSTAVTAAVLLLLTTLLTLALWRFRQVQVVPDRAAAALGGGGEKEWAMAMAADAESGTAADWKPVVVGHPSGKMRRMNVLELGRWSRWSEIRRLNKLLKE